MALMSSWTNIVSSVSPTNGTSDISVDTKVLVTFRIDMVPDSVNSGTITLLDESATKIPATVVYNDVSRTATLTPIVQLEPSMRFKVLINGGTAGVRSATGNILGTDYNTNFTTAGLVPPGQVFLIAPVNKCAFTGLQEFRWNLILGIVTYEIQIANESKFGSLLYSSIITGDSVIPDITFEHDEIYYWRVRAISNTSTPLTGMWSDTWQCRFLISQPGIIPPPVGATPTTPNAIIMDVVKVIPGPDESFVANLNGITVQFTDLVDPMTISSDTFVVKANFLDYAGEPVTPVGYYIITGNVVEFIIGFMATPTTPATPATPVTPTTPVDYTTTTPGNLPITQNTVFTVELRKEIRSTSGMPLVDDIQWVFSTVFTPYYSKIEYIRDELKELGNPLTDLEIARMIHTVSLWADQIAAQPYGSVNSEYLGDTQVNTTNNIFYHNYVRYESALRLITTDTLVRMKYQGGQRQIGDLIIKDGLNLSADYKLTVNRLESLKNQAELYLKMGKNTYPLPKSAIKGANLYPYPLNKRNSF